MLDIKAIRAVTDQATSGPWSLHRYSVDDWNGNQICGDFTSDDNKKFIAAARQWVPALCDEVERIDAEMHKLVDECNRWADIAYKAEEERNVLKRALELEVEESYGKPAPREIIDETMNEAQG
jgi:hypothetical protein